jgi:hypothetical protein
MNPLGRDTGRLGHAGRTRAVRPAGHAADSAQKPILNRKLFFFFKSIL